MPGPLAVMRCIESLASEATERRDILKWEIIGFPVLNDYRMPNVRTINIRDSIRGRVRHEIAEGTLPDIDEEKAIRSASANFVHSLDAAHLIRVVNRANEEGIANLLTIHDSFAVLAPQAAHLGKIVREELRDLYIGDRRAVKAAEQLFSNSKLPWRFRGDVPLVKLVTRNSIAKLAGQNSASWTLMKPPTGHTVFDGIAHG